MIPKLHKILLTSGEHFEVSNGVTAIVGPNNVGKSVLLAELKRWFGMFPGTQMQPPHKILADVETTSAVTLEDLNSWLSKSYPHRPPGMYLGIGNVAEPHFALGGNFYVQDNQLPQLAGSSGRFGPLGDAYSFHATPGSTKGMVGAGQAFNILTEVPQNPIQRLYKSQELEQRISSLVRRAFGTPLTVNRYGGSQITVHLGTVSAPAMPPPGTTEYLEEISALPQVHEQGDGVTTFVGMLLAITTTDYPMLLIDEPETFLHPPQAYLMGQILAEQHDRSAQIIVATHSSDVLRGLTSAKAVSGSVSIVRLTRSETINHVAQLSTETIRSLYDDPLIKYYSILDGLFFHGVVLCEADSDCTYYRAVLDVIDDLEEGIPASSVNLHFAHCGGKARLAKAISSLYAARVPVVCVTDIDFLQNDYEFNAVVRACGGDPNEYSALRNNIISAIKARDEQLERSRVKVELNRLLDAKLTQYITSDEAKKLTSELKPKSGWKVFKVAGNSMLSGDARSSFDRLNTALRELGIFMVHLGELERFHPDIPAANKAEWLRRVLEKKLYEQSTEARNFVEAVASSILKRQ